MSFFASRYMQPEFDTRFDNAVDEGSKLISYYNDTNLAWLNGRNDEDEEVNIRETLAMTSLQLTNTNVRSESVTPLRLKNGNVILINHIEETWPSPIKEESWTCLREGPVTPKSVVTMTARRGNKENQRMIKEIMKKLPNNPKLLK